VLAPGPILCTRAMMLIPIKRSNLSFNPDPRKRGPVNFLR
jgi:hypothetical protein